MITLQVFIDVCLPPNFAIVDFNCRTCICFHPSFVFLDFKLFLQFFPSFTFSFDYFYKEKYSCLSGVEEANPCF